MGGGGGGNNNPEFPTEIRQLWGLAEPLAQQMGTAAQAGRPLWNVPSMPNVPGPVLPSQEWLGTVSGSRTAVDGNPWGSWAVGFC
jgi:hypothetical protein